MSEDTVQILDSSNALPGAWWLARRRIYDRCIWAAAILAVTLYAFFYGINEMFLLWACVPAFIILALSGLWYKACRYIDGRFNDRASQAFRRSLFLLSLAGFTVLQLACPCCIIMYYVAAS